MSEQIDIAVDLGVVPAPLPEILTLRRFVEVATAAPRLLIDGSLHQGCKMILGGANKSNKSWCLLDLAVSVASGQSWWGRQCAKSPVLFINLELHTWDCVAVESFVRRPAGVHGPRRLWLPQPHGAGVKAMLGRHGLELSQLRRFMSGADVFSRQADGTTIAQPYQREGFKLRHSQYGPGQRLGRNPTAVG